jgi:hypothetical protein
MSRDKNKHPTASNVVRRLCRSAAALLAACAALLASPAFAVDSGDIVVASSKGEVHITMSGAERKVRAGGVLELPATVRTGRDGSVELRQGATTVSIGPDTLLEFPSLEKRGAPIDRIVQPRGNAFYDIGKREGRKLRVETPYLVGVIKGTQFNVAAQEASTTISLFEGRLEVRAADDSDVVDLKAGEIASLKRGEKSISVLKMDAGKTPTSSRPAARNDSTNDIGSNAPASRVAPDSDASDLPAGSAVIPVRTEVDVDTDVRPAESQLGADAAVAINLAETVDTTANAAVVVSSAGADVVTSIGVDAGAAVVDAGINATVDAAAGAVDVATNASVDAGLASADLGATTSIDLGAGTVDTAVSAGVDAGSIATTVSMDTAVDLSAGTVDTGLTLDASTPVVDVGVAADAAVDVAAGTVDVGLDVAGTSVDLTADAADTVETITETVTDTVTNTVTDTVDTAGGLLDTLTRLPGRK